MSEAIRFARELNLYRAPCSSLVTAWLRHAGIKNVPSDSDCRKLWFSVGTEQGMVKAAKQMGLPEADPLPGSIALIWQENNDPLLSVVVSGDICVARSFGVLFVGKSKILRSWSVPWAR